MQVYTAIHKTGHFHPEYPFDIFRDGELFMSCASVAELERRGIPIPAAPAAPAAPAKSDLAAYVPTNIAAAFPKAARLSDTPSHLISRIRRGDSATVHAPKEQYDKLWNWCRKQSEDGTVNVKELSSGSGSYYVRRYRSMKRRGRAVPTLTAHSVWSQSKDRNVILMTSVTWQYVY